jgi:sulfide:quinone oxidoreductase
VVDEDRIYAPGDTGDFPVKQAFLAFLQADAVAEDIAAQVAGPRADVRLRPSLDLCH